MSIFKKLFGDPNKKEVDLLGQTTETINKLEVSFSKLSQVELRHKTKQWQQSLAGLKLVQQKEALDKIMPQAFALVREAAKRTLKQRHYDVQVIGAQALHQGKIAEMKTGEGKTLASTMPAYLNALAGRGVHVVTVNEYLARRDAEWMGRIFDYLGLSIACLQHQSALRYRQGGNPESDISQTQMGDEANSSLEPCPRQEAYQADITYGTNSEFGFDYLRDNMVQRLEQRVQRGLYYAIVDEVDSILIDEARTPLIISAPDTESTDKYYQFAKIVIQLKENEDYNIDEKLKSSTLTEEGITKIEKILGTKNIYQTEGIATVHHLEQALRARTLFQKDRDYVVKDNQVIIVDEFTGRLMPGRRFSEGLHQALEAKEGVQVQRESKTLATITLQNYFRMYKKLSGMTGTAATEAEEFSKIYNLDVVVVPTNRPMIRQDLNDVIFKTELGKFKATIREIKTRHNKGQPILVGTISVEKSELLSQLLSKAGVKHEVLNAKNHEREAKIVAGAGQKGAVTIATNMAGRGTDIVLGEGVTKLGGLFVLGTERHESRRIDNQLRGRSGRQGDPGASQFFVSLEDDLMRIFGSDRTKAVMSRLGLPDDQPIEHKMISKSLESAQKKVEGNNFDIRKHLVEYDDVLNKQREVIYNKRRQVFRGSVKEQLFEIFGKEFEEIMIQHALSSQKWNVKEIVETMDAIVPVDTKYLTQKITALSQKDNGQISSSQARTKTIGLLLDIVRKEYKTREEKMSPETVEDLARAVILRNIDQLWLQHLNNMEFLRQSVKMQAYAQKDPLVEYKKQGFDMFRELLVSIQRGITSTFFKVQLISPEQARAMQEHYEKHHQSGHEHKHGSNETEEKPKQEPLKKEKIGRNDPCWCGSGKKYKKCHLNK